MPCVFCDIASKKIHANILYEDEKIISFKDSNPVAPVHFLIIPKKHISSMNDVSSDDIDIIYNILKNISSLCRQLGIESAYRIVNNCGRQAGQTIDHLHFHIFGGRELKWPPG